MKNNKDSLISVFLNHLINYPTPINFNYFFGYGSLSILCLVIQILSGVFLAMHYIPSADLAFMSVEHIMRDVVFGWHIRYAHANGASMFFMCLYIHMLRGLYYGSYIYPRHLTWVTGAIIFILTIATAFLGYVLPWGQMSFWAATVITNLFSAIPLIGNSIVEWLWGGFSVASPTLNRFFSLHFLLPFVITGLVGLHIALVHRTGSNNPLAIENTNSSISFYSYFFIKDLFGVQIFLIIMAGFVYFMPNLLGHPDNYIYADPLVTPAHIVPEWYFLPLYAILRTVPDKLGGVICMACALLSLVFLPFITTTKTKGATFFLENKVWFWMFVVNGVFLGWLGQKEMCLPYLQAGIFGSIVYFVLILTVSFDIKKILKSSTTKFQLFVTDNYLLRIKNKDFMLNLCLIIVLLLIYFYFFIKFGFKTYFIFFIMIITYIFNANIFEKFQKYFILIAYVTVLIYFKKIGSLLLFCFFVLFYFKVSKFSFFKPVKTSFLSVSTKIKNITILKDLKIIDFHLYHEFYFFWLLEKATHIILIVYIISFGTKINNFLENIVFFYLTINIILIITIKLYIIKFSNPFTGNPLGAALSVASTIVVPMGSLATMYLVNTISVDRDPLPLWGRETVQTKILGFHADTSEGLKVGSKFKTHFKGQIPPLNTDGSIDVFKAQALIDISDASKRLK